MTFSFGDTLRIPLGYQFVPVSLQFHLLAHFIIALFYYIWFSWARPNDWSYLSIFGIRLAFLCEIVSEIWRLEEVVLYYLRLSIINLPLNYASKLIYVNFNNDRNWSVFQPTPWGLGVKFSCETICQKYLRILAISHWSASTFSRCHGVALV